MFFLLRQLVHQVQHQLFKDDAQAARADVAFDGFEGDRFESVIGKLEFDILVLEQASDTV